MEDWAVFFGLCRKVGFLSQFHCELEKVGHTFHHGQRALWPH